MKIPTPLRVRSEDGPPLTDILADDGRLLATVYPKSERGSRGEATLRAYADAEAITRHIVRCVNLHDELCKTLQELIFHGGAANWFCEPEDEEIVAQARAVLAKAREP